MKKLIVLFGLVFTLMSYMLSFADDTRQRVLDRQNMDDREEINRDLRNAIEGRDMKEIQRQQRRMEDQLEDEQFRRRVNQRMNN